MSNQIGEQIDRCGNAALSLFYGIGKKPPIASRMSVRESQQRKTQPGRRLINSHKVDMGVFFA